MFGHNYHITYVRKLLHRYNLTPKSAQNIHVNHASISAVRSWQYRLKPRILRLEERGFAVMVEDEAHVIHDTRVGRKFWTEKGKRYTVPYTGSHKKITVFGSMTVDRRRLFRSYDKLDAKTFITYLKEAARKFGKIAMICDRAPAHTAKKTKAFVNGRDDIELIYLPKGSPWVNAIEECWHQLRQDIFVSRYYKTFGNMCKAVAKYFRYKAFMLDPKVYLYRSAYKHLTNL